MDSVLSMDQICRASRLLDDSDHRQLSPLQLDALRGQLNEFSAPRGHPQVTVAMERIAEAHRAGEPAAWIGPSTAMPYPPDAAGWGVDWSALALVRIDDPRRAGVAADKLLRSGGFGLVVLDLIDADDDPIPSPLAGRLMRLADTHDSALVVLTQKQRRDPCVCPLVARRVQIRWTDVGARRLQLDCTVTRDKRRGASAELQEEYHGALRLR